MANRPSLDDYVDVAERIQDFMDAHPKGRLQRVSWEVREIGNASFVVYTARAYPDKGSDAEDYGEGTAWEPFPGRTPYTKDSELMNAETAAWGRAIVALGLVANRKLASRQEVRNRMEDQAADESKAAPTKVKSPPDPTPTQAIGQDVLDRLRTVCNEVKAVPGDLAWFLVSVGVETLPEDPSKSDIQDAMAGLTLEQAFKLEALLKGEDESTPGSGEAS